MTAIRGIIFDKDGTLFDFGATWEAWAHGFLLRLTNGDRPRAKRIGLDIGYDTTRRRFDRDSVVIAGTPDEVAAALRPHFGDLDHAAVLDLINDEAKEAPQSEATPLQPLLQRFRDDGIALGVATNDAVEPALTHLRVAGVETFFDFIAGFDSGYGAKPAPGQLQAFCSATGLPPESVVMVGDSLHDLHAGDAAGMRRVGVLTGLADEDTLRPFADAVLPHIGHLPDWIAGQREGLPKP